MEKRGERGERERRGREERETEEERERERNNAMYMWVRRPEEGIGPHRVGVSGCYE